MKKYLSILLAISLLLSMSLPIVAAEDEPIEIQLYKVFKNSSIGQSIQNTDVNPISLLASMLKLQKSGFSDKVIADYTSILNQNPNNQQVRDFVKNNYAVSKEDVLSLVNVLKNWISGNDISDFFVLEDLFDKLKAGDDLTTGDTEIITLIDSLRTAVESDLTTLITEWETNVLKAGYSKTQFALDIMGKVLENSLVTEKSDYSLVFSVKGSKEEVNADLIVLQDTYLKSGVAKLSEGPFDYYATLTDLVEQLNSTVSSIVTDTTLTNADVKNVVKAFGMNFKAYVAPSVPPVVTPEPKDPEVTIPEDNKKPVEVSLPKDSVKVEETEDSVSGEVSEESIDKAIEAIGKLSGTNKEKVEVVIEVPNTNNKGNVNLNLSVSAVEKLTSSKANLVVKSGNVEFNIPFDALKFEVADKDSKVSLSFNTLSKEDSDKVSGVVDSVKPSQVNTSKTLKVLDFKMSTTDKNNNVKSITKFNSSLKIKVDVKDINAEEYDNLAVYYINDEDNTIKFVGGKIKDGKVEFKTNHFSKYALLSVDITYSDIDTHWAKQFIKAMGAKNVIGGYPDGSFKPSKDISRAEFITLVVNALELDLVDYNNKFSDVKSTDWHSKYIATAEKAGIISGYPDGSFKPNNEITRLEMASVLSNALGEVLVTDTEIAMVLDMFKDKAEIKNWGKEALAKAVKSGLLVGRTDGSFSPNGLTIRGEAATAIYRLYNK